MMELIDGIMPPGVINIVTAGREGSEALVAHPLVPRISLIGSVPTGRAIMKAGADRLKHVTLELGARMPASSTRTRTWTRPWPGR